MKWTWTVGNRQVRATLASRWGGFFLAWKKRNIRSLGSHKRPWLSLCFLLYSNTAWRGILTDNNANCSADTLETIDTPGPVTVEPNSKCTMCYCWPTATLTMSQFGHHEWKLTESNCWIGVTACFLMVLERFWSNVHVSDLNVCFFGHKLR